MNFMKQYRIYLRNCAGRLGEREYTVQPEEMEKKQRRIETNTKEVATTSGKTSEREQNFWNKYLDQLEHFHYEEEQWAYYQGIRM